MENINKIEHRSWFFKRWTVSINGNREQNIKYQVYSTGNQKRAKTTCMKVKITKYN